MLSAPSNSPWCRIGTMRSLVDRPSAKGSGMADPFGSGQEAMVVFSVPSFAQIAA